MKLRLKFGAGLLAIISSILLIALFATCSLQDVNGGMDKQVTQGNASQTKAPSPDLGLQFFKFNYCGSGQTASWRSNCHMQDNPVGGYHDAGDHVKFGLPAAFAASMLCWADYEYGIGGGTEIKRFMDYFKACWNGSTFIYQVGDGGADHSYWGPPELQTGSRPSYSTTQASCVIAGTAAALALGYITGNGGDLNLAKTLYSVAENAKSDSGYTAANGYYNSYSGFYDELIWAAVWLYIATGDNTYLTKAETYFGNLSSDYKWTHSWDDVRYGAILKLAQLTGKKVYVDWIEKNLDFWMKGGGITYTPGGLPWLDSWGCLRYASAAAFLAKIWGDYTAVGTASKKATYKSFASSVINYINGSNPKNMSYIIGNGSNYPKCPHHRAAAPNKECPAKYTLTGALVGGPDSSDNYTDDVNQYVYTEVAIDYNACLVAALAAVNGSLISPVYPTPTPPPTSPVGTGTGLTGEYFNNTSLSGTPVLTRVDSNLNVNWGGGSPGTGVNSDQFSVRWTGQIEPRMTETYTFYLMSDDGSRLYINNTLVVDNWSDHAATSEYEKSGSIALTMGTKYNIRVELYENAGDAAIYLSWSNPWLEKEIVPMTQLYPSATSSSASSVVSSVSSSRSSAVSSAISSVSSSRSSAVSSISSSRSSAVSSAISSVASSVSSVQYTEITLPFTKDGAGDLYWKSNKFSTTQNDYSRYVNSWNVDILDINGTSYANKWVAEFQIPAASDGYWYIHYKGSYAWSHVEIK